MTLRRSRIWLSLSLLAAIAAAPQVAQKSSPIPQTALSVCPVLAVTDRQKATAGTHLAVSPDGRYQAELVHTNVGAQVKLRQRDSGQERTVTLEPPTLPPGVLWQVAEMKFSSAGDLLVIRSVGAVWVLQAGTAQVLYEIGPESKPMLFPGQVSLAGRQLAVSFWPPESYLADAVTTKPVEVRFYDALGGQVLSHLALPFNSTNNWTVLRLSPDGKWLAALLRATHWPGKARLVDFAADTGKPRWEKKISGEDIDWLGNGSLLLALGDRLIWLTGDKGDQVEASSDLVRFSEFQQLRVSEPARLAAGQFQQFSFFRRALGRSYPHEKVWELWQLGTRRLLCGIKLDRETDVDAWLTFSGEVVALEETYELRPPLRLLRSSRLVTYKVTLPPEGAASPAKQKK